MKRSTRGGESDGCVVVLLAIIILILLFGGPFKVEVKTTPVPPPTTAKGVSDGN